MTLLLRDQACRSLKMGLYLASVISLHIHKTICIFAALLFVYNKLKQLISKRAKKVTNLMFSPNTCHSGAYTYFIFLSQETRYLA